MKRSEHEELLADVLCDAKSGEFRTVVLAQTVQLARGRRLRRRVQRVASVVSALVLGAIVAWRAKPARDERSTIKETCAVVYTQPLSETAIVGTRAMRPGEVVETTGTIVVVSTKRDGGRFHFVNDAELMALAGPRPAVLVRVGPNEQELIFVDGAENAETKVN